MNKAEILANYSVQVQPLTPDLGGGYEALFPLLARSVVGYGDTRQDAISDLIDAAPAFIEALVEAGQRLPGAEAPKAWDEYSGKFNVRVPKLLHAKLSRLADEQGVSLNSMVQTILMSGATALDAGHEFGAIIEDRPEPEIQVLYKWRSAPTTSTAHLRIEYSDTLTRERNPDEWIKVS